MLRCCEILTLHSKSLFLILVRHYLTRSFSSSFQAQMEEERLMEQVQRVHISQASGLFLYFKHKIIHDFSPTCLFALTIIFLSSCVVFWVCNVSCVKLREKRIKCLLFQIGPLACKCISQSSWAINRNLSWDYFVKIQFPRSRSVSLTEPD